MDTIFGVIHRLPYGQYLVAIYPRLAPAEAYAQEEQARYDASMKKLAAYERNQGRAAWAGRVPETWTVRECAWGELSPAIGHAE